MSTFILYRKIHPAQSHVDETRDNGKFYFIYFEECCAYAESFLEPENVKTPPHKLIRIIGPCQYVYEKRVGLVGAMSYPDEVWGHCKPPQGPRLCLVGKNGRSPQNLLRSCISHYQKWSKTARFPMMGVELATPWL